MRRRKEGSRLGIGIELGLGEIYQLEITMIKKKNKEVRHNKEKEGKDNRGTTRRKHQRRNNEILRYLDRSRLNVNDYSRLPRGVRELWR